MDYGYRCKDVLQFLITGAHRAHEKHVNAVLLKKLQPAGLCVYTGSCHSQPCFSIQCLSMITINNDVDDVIFLYLGSDVGGGGQKEREKNNGSGKTLSTP